MTCGARAFGLGCAWLLGLSNLADWSAEADTARLAHEFRDPPVEARPRLFWRVFGPAWEPAEIDYQLALMRDAGVGGVTLFLFYPVAVEGSGIHNQQFLSREFLDTLGYAARKARELGLRFSVAGGTGWPFGGPGVSDADAAQRLSQVTVPAEAGSNSVTTPSLKPGESLIAAFCDRVKITDRFGGTNPPAPPGLQGRRVWYVAGPTGMRVKRSALGGEGLVLDHYCSAATQRYFDTVVDPMLKAAPGLIASVFCDSLEVYRGNWTSGLPGAFRKRRGYDLLSSLPDLFDQDSVRSPEIRFDYWRTLSELTEERFTRFTSRWAHRHGIQLEMEAYGTPPNPLTAARYIDIPTGEQYEWRGFSLSRLAASGAHLAGKRVIGAEAWTWLGLPNRLGDNLSDMKLASDLHFLGGVNDLTGVDFAYSPRSVGAPGWLPYYGPVLNQNNPQWPWFKYLAAYASRCQWLLRQGRPVADVALYLPIEDKFAFGPVDQMLLGFQLRDHFVSGEKTGEFGLQTALRHRSQLIETLFQEGHNYDGIDFFSVNRLARVRQGHLLAGDGDYRVLLWPRLIGIEREALEKMVEFCKSGGTIVATERLPEHVYGSSSVGSSKRSRALLNPLLGEAPTATQPWSRDVGRGQFIFVSDENAGLRQALSRFPADVRMEPVQAEVGFVHRRTPFCDIYFLANVGSRPLAFRAGFRSPRTTAEAWDPLTGEITRLTAEKDSIGLAWLPMELPARASTFVVFAGGLAALPAVKPTFEEQEIKPLWTLTFEGTNAPPSRSMTDLLSWTAWPESRYFSGCATYTGEFSWRLPRPRRARLRLSEVHEVAQVRINGHDAGPVWNPPFEVDIAPWLKPGTNSLSITVANLPLNLFLGTPDPDLRLLRATYGDRFPDPEEKRVVPEPVASGLMGSLFIRSSQ